MPSDLTDRSMPMAPVRMGKTIQQGRRGAGKGDFEVKGQGVIVDSGHGREKNKDGTLSQSP